MSLTFGGAASDRVPVGNVGDALDNWTWYGWLYPTTVTAARRIFSKSDPSSPFGGYDIRIGASGFLRTDVIRGAGTPTDFRSNSGALTTNSWQFVAVTFDAAASPAIHIYKGSLTSAAAELTYGTASDGSGAVQSSAADTTIGNLPVGAGSQAFQGRIDHVGFFNRTMSLAEVVSHQWNPRVAAGCLGFWRLGENGTTNVPDFSGNLNTGTISGPTLGDNPPLVRPWHRRIIGPPYAVAGAAFNPAWARRANQFTSPSMVA